MRDDPAKLLLGPGGNDVPRNQEGLALIGDPRNDVHLFVNQLHVAFLRAHNLVVDRLREDGVDEADMFDEARRATMWHYQWILLHDYLPSLIGAELTTELANEGPRYYAIGDEPYIPFEFADAAFRYGHSQIRHRYRINATMSGLAMFPDLMGFGAVPPERAVDWALLFDLPGKPPAQRVEADGRPPAREPDQPAGADHGRRGRRGLPLARRARPAARPGDRPALGRGDRALHRRRPVDPADIGLASHGWRDETPLWFYILREADVVGDGDRLGPVGGRIVGEVLIGLLNADPESYRAVDPGWRPTLPSADRAHYSLADLLAIGQRTDNLGETNG